MVGVTPEGYALVRLVVHLASCLYADEYGGGSGTPFVRKHIIYVLVSDTVRPNAAHTTAITPIIFLSCSGDCETTSNSMFARLGTDYEIRNQWLFAILEAMNTD